MPFLVILLLFFLSACYTTSEEQKSTPKMDINTLESMPGGSTKSFYYGPLSKQMVYRNHIYEANIKTVQLHPVGNPQGDAIINLGALQGLELTFDQIGRNVDQFVYTFIHCRQDWTPSELTPFEYIDGFTTIPINNYNFSSGTTENYIHYSLRFPDEQMKIKKSGNYLLKIWREGDESDLILTWRFSVLDSRVRINAAVNRPSLPEYRYTHQAVNFSIDLKDFPVNNPYEDILVNVFQNDRWDNAMMSVRPDYIRMDELEYNNAHLVFEAGKEFRFFSTRSFRFLTERVAATDRIGGYRYIYLLADALRTNQSYVYRPDNNGNFFVEVEELNQDHVQADYAVVRFTLPFSTNISNGDLYVCGAFSQWEANPTNRMTYNEELQAYMVDILLKQGYYEYQYIFTEGNDVYDHKLVEGNYFEAENNYTIMVYHRNFSERNDELVGYFKINSLRQ